MIEQHPLNSKIYRQAGAIIIIAFIIKIILAAVIPTQIRSDSIDYFNLAKSVIETGVYALEGKPTAYLACGYPMFLVSVFKVFGYDFIAVRIIQSFLEIFTGIFFFLISLNFFKPKYSLLSLFIFTFLPSNLLFSQAILTESLFGFLFAIIFYYCIRENINNKIILIGLLWGTAVLVRSSFSASVVVMLLFLFIKRKQIFEGYKTKRIKRAFQYSFMFLTGVIVVVAPWIIRNKITMNTFTIATQGGFTFWAGSNPDATGTWYYKIVDSNPLFKMEDEVERDREFYRQGIDYALNNPHKFLMTGVKKIGYLFSSERLIILYFAESPPGKNSTEVYKAVNPFFIALVNIPYFVIMLCGIWGLLAFKKKTFFIWGFMMQWCFTFFMFVALARYHYVLIPFFVLGTVKLIQERRNIFKELSKFKIILAAAFNLFLLGVWFVEFYLLLKV